MLEVVFGQSAAGSLSLAMSKKKASSVAGAVGVIVSHLDGSKASKKEIHDARREFEERERRLDEEMIPIDGSREDICCFDLILSVGDIDEQGIGEKRAAVISQMMGTYPDMQNEVAKELLENSRKSLEKLLSRVEKGENIRVWASSEPDDICGLYWLSDMILPLLKNGSEVLLVELPKYREGENTLVQYSGWGEVEHQLWGKFAENGKKLPFLFIQAMASHWKELKTENSPLRALLSDRLTSFPETLYDPFILRELEREKNEFHEAHLIGRTLAKYRLGIGDTWLSLRIEEFIRSGLLEIVTEPKAGDPIYHRILRKSKELTI